MNISKISRSLVVVIFVAFILYLSFLNITLLLDKNNSDTIVSNNLIKIGYAIVILFLVSFYMYIKDKLYKMRVKRSISFIYRYIYIVLMVIGTSLISVKNIIGEFSKFDIAIYIIFALSVSLIVKRIIFNVSKSDILSVFGMFMCSFLPNIILDTHIHFNSMIINISFFLTILVLQILIDELKQKGMKTRKYLIESFILGGLIGLSMALAINPLIYIAVAISMIFITINLDNTHITFPNKIMTSITKEKREALYKIERININKLLVSIIVSSIFAVLVYELGGQILSKINQDVFNSQVIRNAVENLDANKISNINAHINQVTIYGKNLIMFSKSYYMIIFVYILCLEFLAFILRRRYDTKSTVMKIIFISMFLIIPLFNLNIYYYQPMLTVLLVIIAIVNTSNIYLNREERIKMLVA